MNVNACDLDELDDLILSSSPKSVKSDPEEAEIKEVEEVTTPEKEPSENNTPEQKPAENKPEPKKVPSKSKIDLILSSTADELDTLEIGPPPVKGFKPHVPSKPQVLPKPTNIGQLSPSPLVELPETSNLQETEPVGSPEIEEPVKTLVVDDSPDDEAIDFNENSENVSDGETAKENIEPQIEQTPLTPEPVAPEPVTPEPVVEKPVEQKPPTPEPVVETKQEPEPAVERPSFEKVSTKTAMYEKEPEPVSPPAKEQPNVGSIHDRLTKYTSASTPDEDKSKSSGTASPTVGKLGNIRDTYLKQANNQKSPSHGAPVRVKSSGVMERMKLLEQNSKSNLVRRETVNMGERASDIKSRISGWGKSHTTNNVLE